MKKEYIIPHSLAYETTLPSHLLANSPDKGDGTPIGGTTDGFDVKEDNAEWSFWEEEE